MEEGSIAVLVDAKEEYTKQLISVLKPCIYQGVKSIYLDAKDICNQDNTPEKVLMVFQDLLSRIPKWSQDIITKEFERIVSVSKCDYIEDLLKVIYVSHIKVLTIVHSTQKNKKLSIKVPNGGHFIHLCYIECAREFWKDPYLFSENANKYELQKNMRDSESMISECIAETIRKQLPVRHILKEFLNEPDEEIEEAEEDVREPVNKKYMKKLESVVKKELKTTTKDNSGDIDIDLIRKVIREELSSRPETNVIKKELVETVIEKIVEQANDTETTSKNMEKVSESVNLNDSINVSNKLDEIPVMEKEKPVDKDNISANGGKASSVVNDESDLFGSDKLEDLLEEVSFKQPKLTIENNTTEIETDISNNITVKNSEESKTKLNDEIVIDTTKTTNDDSLSIKNATPNKTESANKLKIDEIDEINLNLDELDNDTLQIDDKDLELEDFDLSSKKSNQQNTGEVSNNKDNTKYIFFKE